MECWPRALCLVAILEPTDEIDRNIKVVDTRVGLMSVSDTDAKMHYDKYSYVGGDAATHTRDGLPVRACASDF